MRSSVKFTFVVFSSLLAGGALAAPRDPLVIPGIGPEYAPAAVYRPRQSPAAAYPASRRHARYWIAEARPRSVRVAAFAPTRFEGERWEAPRPYDDEYRPAAYNAADAYPPPARPWLRAAPFCHDASGW
jgi:hypothetical protein